MGIRRIGVDQERRAVDRAVGVEALTVDAVATAVLAVVGPHRDEAAAGQADDVRLALRDRTFTPRVGLGLASLGHAGGVVALEIDVAVLGEAGVVIVGAPRHDEAAVGGGRDVGLELAVVGRAVHKEFAAQQRAVVGEALRIDARAAAVLSLGAPGDHVAAAGQRRYYRLGLPVRRIAVDLELGAHRHALGVEALGIDAIAPAVLTVRGPDGDVAAVGQARHLGRLLRAGLVSVDLGVVKQRLCAVVFGGNVDHYRTCHAGAAVAVGHADRHGAGQAGVGEGVGVGQVLDQPLHRYRRGVGIELHGQLGAVDAVADDGADDRAAVAHGVARHADLPGAIALMADAQLVLVVQTLQAELVLQVVAGQVVDFEEAAVEVGRVDVGQADHRVDELRCRVYGVLAESDARRHINQHRVGLAHEVGRVAENLLVDVVVGDRRVVVSPRHGEGTIRQPDHAGRVGVVDVGRVDAQLAVQARSTDIELLCDDLAVVQPGDDEATMRQRRHRSFCLVARGAGVHAELAAHRGAGAGVALREHAVAVAVLQV